MITVLYKTHTGTLAYLRTKFSLGFCADQSVYGCKPNALVFLSPDINFATVLEQLP